ncbi:ATP-binding protein [Streptomyces rochei]|uniref:ATP-binding protein n=1 Tax=Streptomyces rochei TaxID=1928 RepID=UPI0035317CF6
MSVLVLHRFPLDPFPYDRWLADHDGGVVMIAARDCVERGGEQVPEGHGGYRHLEIVDSFDDDEDITRRALALARRHGVTRVIAHHEAELLRAALLRERLGLPGPRREDVLPFRDKVLMKRLAAEAGIEVAAHTVPGTADDVRAFARLHGLPLVFKARDGFGSIGLRIVRTEEELADHLRREFPAGAAPREDVLLESYVPGRMCHVDGLVAGGRTVLSCPSQYQYDLASYRTDRGARIDLTLDPDDPVATRLVALTGRLLRVLGAPADTAFHAEIFHTPDDRLVLCEIACRPPGGRIRDVLKAVYEVHPVEYAARAEAGLPLPALDGLPPGALLRPLRMAGQALIMKRPGEVRAVPRPPSEPYVEFYGVFARPGQRLGPAEISSDFLAAAVLTGDTRAVCEERLRAVGRRFEREIVIT